MERTVKIQMNGELRGTPRVRVIGSAGETLGVMTVAAALRLALKEGLDLVEVNPKADPPVCKILDFGKYKYAARSHAAEREPAGRDASEDAVSIDVGTMWTPFDCDGRPFEYAVIRTNGKTRPSDWPVDKASPGPWVPGVAVVVRKPGEANGPAMVFPEGTAITSANAVEAVRMFWTTLTT